MRVARPRKSIVHKNRDIAALTLLSNGSNVSKLEQWLQLGRGGEGGAQGSDRTCRKVDVRLPEKGNSNSHGARPVHLIITMKKWIRTSRFSIKNSLSGTYWWRGRRGGTPSAPETVTVLYVP